MQISLSYWEIFSHCLFISAILDNVKKERRPIPGKESRSAVFVIGGFLMAKIVARMTKNANYDFSASLVCLRPAVEIVRHGRRDGGSEHEQEELEPA